ncbi:MAG: oxygenase MpaB family protein [Solirubrobacterales bacterium]
MEQQLVGTRSADSPIDRVLAPSARPRGVLIPAGPHDWGLFGPDSISWRVHSNPVLLVGGLRALIIQSLNPLAMAGIDQHSDYLSRPLSRLRRTAEYVATVVYGDSPSAQRAAAIVQRLHSRVEGADPITGSPYSAADTETKLWVHCVETHSFLAAYRAYGARMDDAEQDAYLAEQVSAAELMGIPPELVPSSRAGYRDFFEYMRPGLCVSEASQDAIHLVVDPPKTRELLPHQVSLRTMASAAVAITPRYMRRMAGIERSRAVYAGAATGTRISGVLMRARVFDRIGGALVGRRTVSLPRAAKAAAKAHRS